jgi:Arylsulfotransferase (ASST)
MSVRVEGSRGWQARFEGNVSAGTFDATADLEPGQAIAIAFRRTSSGAARHFYVRCLPSDFPDYSFRRMRQGGPKRFMIEMANQYAAIFDRNGVPVWWYRADGYTDDAKVLSDGTISWSSVDAATYQTGPFDVLDLTGRILRTVGSGDLVDVHDLQLLPNGNYLIGEQDRRSGIDASDFGGSTSGAATGIKIEELTPDGEQVRSWDSFDHIGLDQTPQRWWDQIVDDDYYDIVHWNAVEPDGRYMYLSFRHLDAIYKVDRKTGEIVWKLGGIETPESLEVIDDPAGDYPLGGQHDVRAEPNGTITVFNNRTELGDAVPRAQRFRIDEEAGTAKLVETVTDRRITSSYCCGSARRLPSKDWLVAWGGYAGFVGAYDGDDRVVFRLRTPGAFTYRANPLPADGPGAVALRRAMNAMYE